MATDTAFDAAWFESQPFGSPFAPVAAIEPTYCVALQLAQCELEEVLCWCPEVYEAALQIKIALILIQMAPDPAANGAVMADAGAKGDRFAMVKRDKVYDTERVYEFFEKHEQLTQSSPANLLAKIVDKCKAPAIKGALLVGRQVASACSPCGSIDFSRIGGDKADDWPY